MRYHYIPWFSPLNPVWNPGRPMIWSNRSTQKMTGSRSEAFMASLLRGGSSCQGLQGNGQPRATEGWHVEFLREIQSWDSLWNHDIMIFFCHVQLGFRSTRLRLLHGRAAALSSAHPLWVPVCQILSDFPHLWVAWGRNIQGGAPLNGMFVG